MAANEKNRAYWQGYRDARIDAFIYLVDNLHEFSAVEGCRFSDSDTRERYVAGYQNGIASIWDSLAKEIAKSDKYAS